MSREDFRPPRNAPRNVGHIQVQSYNQSNEGGIVPQFQTRSDTMVPPHYAPACHDASRLPNCSPIGESYNHLGGAGSHRPLTSGLGYDYAGGAYPASFLPANAPDANVLAHVPVPLNEVQSIHSPIGNAVISPPFYGYGLDQPQTQSYSQSQSNPLTSSRTTLQSESANPSVYMSSQSFDEWNRGLNTTHCAPGQNSAPPVNLHHSHPFPGAPNDWSQSYFPSTVSSVPVSHPSAASCSPYPASDIPRPMPVPASQVLMSNTRKRAYNSNPNANRKRKRQNDLQTTTAVVGQGYADGHGAPLNDGGQTADNRKRTRYASPRNGSDSDQPQSLRASINPEPGATYSFGAGSGVGGMKSFPPSVKRRSRGSGNGTRGRRNAQGKSGGRGGPISGGHTGPVSDLNRGGTSTLKRPRSPIQNTVDAIGHKEGSFVEPGKKRLKRDAGNGTAVSVQDKLNDERHPAKLGDHVATMRSGAEQTRKVNVSRTLSSWTLQGRDTGANAGGTKPNAPSALGEGSTTIGDGFDTVLPPQLQSLNTDGVSRSSTRAPDLHLNSGAQALHDNFTPEDWNIKTTMKGATPVPQESVPVAPPLPKNLEAGGQNTQVVQALASGSTPAQQFNSPEPSSVDTQTNSETWYRRFMAADTDDFASLVMEGENTVQKVNRERWFTGARNAWDDMFDSYESESAQVSAASGSGPEREKDIDKPESEMGPQSKAKCKCLATPFDPSMA
ncbi:hypothetical protein AX16_005048 [Volvariella volvacea WC 439]|nr:hypothetical protein AX16_005048 [Volvariella volvacea WC 439]